MPSIRKRIGYLPSINIQEIITKIAKEERLSQSKVVGILVEEALISRGLFDYANPNNLIRKSSYSKGNNMNNSLKYSSVEELISDKGITYNTKNYNLNSDDFSSKSKESYNKELFEQFKQFVLFQQIMKDK